MLVHGRDPGAYAHFNVIGLWPDDPDFTISSLAKLLPDLESYFGDKAGDLSLTSVDSHVSLFNALLDKDAFEEGYLKWRNISLVRFRGETSNTSLEPLYSTDSVIQPPDDREVGQLSGHWSIGVSQQRDACEDGFRFSPLPRHFHLQMDNSAKDNKNEPWLFGLTWLCAFHVLPLMGL
ncbi:unnamed protein product [Calypogeia fissa]